MLRPYTLGERTMAAHALPISLPRRPITSAEYQRMIEAGILHEDERVELLEGVIVEMTPIGARHVATIMALERLLRKRVPDEIGISVQSPIQLSDFSEPQPDIVLVRPRDDSYMHALPQPEDVLLLIEVSDTSAAYDRNTKVPLYARAGVGEVWLIDLVAGVVEVFREPRADGYRSVTRPGREESLTPLAIPGLSLPVGEMLV
jgi:Uma2 family endonuclease